MDASFHLTLYYSGLFQDFQVLGNGGLGGPELAAELPGAARLAVRQCTNHGTPGAVGQSVECKIESRTVLHSQLTIYWLDGIGNTEVRFALHFEINNSGGLK